MIYGIRLIHGRVANLTLGDITNSCNIMLHMRVKQAYHLFTHTNPALCQIKMRWLTLPFVGEIGGIPGDYDRRRIGKLRRQAAFLYTGGNLVQEK